MTHPDVLIAGAGPSGVAAACALAREGFLVEVVHSGAPEAPYDVFLDSDSVASLSCLSWTPSPDTREIASTTVHVGDGSPRLLSDIGGVVTDRSEFVAALTDEARRHGVLFSTGRATTTEHGRVVVVAADGQEREARHVILATGPAVGRNARGRGWTVAQRVRTESPLDSAVLILIEPTSTTPDAPPTAVWAYPGSSGHTWLRVSAIGGERTVAVGTETAFAAVRRARPDLGAIEEIGPLATGVIDASFDPSSLTDFPALRIGAAAGLTNPFTGDGIGHAVQSGLLAAREIMASPDDPARVRKGYRRSLASSYVGQFEGARHAARRYHLSWRVLASSNAIDVPFHVKGRRSVLLGAGLGGMVDQVNLPRSKAAYLDPFLMACDEVLVESVRRDWPFLARITSGVDRRRDQLRPAILLATGLMSRGEPPAIDHAAVAAAIELISVGALAFIAPPAHRQEENGISWASAGAVLSGDFLLAKASVLVSRHAPHLSGALSDWLNDLTAVRAARLVDPVRILSANQFAAFFEFPLRIGGGLVDAEDRVDTLRTVGSHCGVAFQHAEEVLALRGRRTRLDCSLTTMFEAHLTDLDESLPEAGAHEFEAAVQHSATACLDAATRAQEAAEYLAAPAAALASSFLRAVTSPARRELSSSRRGEADGP